MHVWAYMGGVMKKSSTAIFLHTAMCVCVAKIEAWHQLLDLTRVGEGIGESGKMKHAYTTRAHISLYFFSSLLFYFGACVSVRLSRFHLCNEVSPGFLHASVGAVFARAFVSTRPPDMMSGF